MFLRIFRQTFVNRVESIGNKNGNQYLSFMKKLSLFTVALFFSIGGGGVYAQGAFVHPGLLHSQNDFDQIKKRLAEHDAQTLQAFEVLKNSWVANKAVNDIWGVTEYIKRGIAGDENYMNAYRNAAKAYQCALLWKITGETQWAERAVYVLNQYVAITKGIGGNTNQSLVPGFIGYQFLNAAELMRDYEKWEKEDFERFKQWMIDVWFTTAQDFLERRHDTVVREGNWYHYHSNWGLGNALFCVSLGIFADLPDIYNYGMYWIKEGPGNESLYVGDSHPVKQDQGMCGYGWGLIPWFHEDTRGPFGYLNQMQESGRDQGHAMAALGLLSYALQSAYNQGDNAFCNLYNPLIPGEAGQTMVAGAAEYVAMYNCNQVDPADIPYTQNWWMGGLSGTGRGQWRPIWQLFINHYQNRMGMPMEYCTRMSKIVGIEAGGGSYGTNSGGFGIRDADACGRGGDGEDEAHRAFSGNRAGRYCTLIRRDERSEEGYAVNLAGCIARWRNRHGKLGMGRRHERSEPRHYGRCFGCLSFVLHQYAGGEECADVLHFRIRRGHSRHVDPVDRVRRGTHEPDERVQCRQRKGRDPRG